MPSSAEAEEQDRTLLLDVEEPARSFHIHRSCRTWWLAASFLLLAAFAVLLGQNITVRLKQDARSVDAERPSRLVADEALSALKTAKKDTLLKANTSEHPGRPSHHLRAAGVLQAPEAQSANESASPAAECKTAEPGDKCYKAVLWAKWIGLVEHPGWYEGLDRTTANRHAIQEWLADNGQGGCKKPCGGSIGGYPLPPLDKGKPSLYCFSVARKGPEMDIMYMQQQIRSGIFGCDGFSVYSDSHVNIDGFQTKLIPSTYAGVSRDGYAANSQVFMKTWMAILTGSEWYKYDFIAKVDPDCVFFPSRLRGHVAKYVGQNVFFLNCGKYIPVTMYGALEVFSKSSLGAYLSQHASCEQRFPFGAWGEDKYMTNCLESLGSKPVVDFGNFLHDERCWGVDCGNKATVAFHAFKQVDKWYNCWLLSENDGY
mmetsp:Transcript_132859/g.187673  ORF Transcript_132859/g.187673 Transcript_132859/m.187673 type:complete len:428 (-) Transcript_132859:50-1333(-)|eukprot:s3026_g5.t2